MTWLKQSLIFLVIAACCSFGTYLIKGEYDRSVPCEQDRMQAQEVCLKTVLDEWGNDVVWVDARAEEEKEVRIHSAIEISEQNAEEDLSNDRVMMTLFQAKGKGTRVVVFCQTDGCGSSAYVREKIISKSLHKPEFVYYLHGGWKAIAADGRLLSSNTSSSSH